MNFLASTVSTLRSSRAERTAEYQSLVRTLAREEAVDTDVEAVLESAGKTVDDLDRDVHALQRRQKARAVADTSGQASSDLQSVRTRIAAVDAEFARAVQVHANAMASLIVEQADAARRSQEANDALAELRRTASPELLEQGKAIARQRQVTEQNRRATLDRLHDIEACLAGLANRNAKSPEQIYTADIERANARKLALQQKLTQISIEATDLEHRDARHQAEIVAV